MTSHAVVRGLCVSYGERLILHEVDLDLRRGECLVVMGPGGGGKSTLLRTLLGVGDAPAGVVIGSRDGADPLVHLSQIPRGLVGQRPQAIMASVHENLIQAHPLRATMTPLEQKAYLEAWLVARRFDDLARKLETDALGLSRYERQCLMMARALLREPEILGFDEPTADLDDESADALLDRIKELTPETTIVLVTHNQRHGRRVADRLMLFAGGRVVECTEAERFFTDPRTEEGRTFIRTGGCALPSAAARAEDLAPEYQHIALAEPVAKAAKGEERPVAQEKFLAGLPRITQIPAAHQGPRGFTWLIPGRLGGTPQPGLFRPLEEDGEALGRVGVNILVNLMEERLMAGPIAELGIDVMHYPIVDMEAPDVASAVRFLQTIDERLVDGEVVAFHCRAGLGRTGTMLAAWLILRGLNAKDALKRTRQAHRLWVQSEEQERFLENLHAWLVKERGTESHASMGRIQSTDA